MGGSCPAPRGIEARGCLAEGADEYLGKDEMGWVR